LGSIICAVVLAWVTKAIGGAVEFLVALQRDGEEAARPIIHNIREIVV